VFESDNLSGSFQHHAFVSNARSTSIDRSTGQTHVAWAQIGDGTVMAERIGGDWTKATVYPAPSRLDPIVVSAGGRATVWMASAVRIYQWTHCPSGLEPPRASPSGRSQIVRAPGDETWPVRSS
jgi:hypothetical protein